MEIVIWTETRLQIFDEITLTIGTHLQLYIKTEYTQSFKDRRLMMMLTQCLESRFVQFELQVLFACKDGNFEKSGQLVRVAKIAPTLLTVVGFW